jgi:hypothetical protein
LIASPSFLTIRQISPSQTQGTVHGQPGEYYVVEGSTNLLHWAPVLTNAAASEEVGYLPHAQRKALNSEYEAAVCLEKNYVCVESSSWERYYL